MMFRLPKPVSSYRMPPPRTLDAVQAGFGEPAMVDPSDTHIGRLGDIPDLGFQICIRAKRQGPDRAITAIASPASRRGAVRSPEAHSVAGCGETSNSTRSSARAARPCESNPISPSCRSSHPPVARSGHSDRCRAVAVRAT